jgi:microcompartment protein CcmL/EutN
VEAAMEAGVAYVKDRGLLCRETVIQRPHRDMKSFFL